MAPAPLAPGPSARSSSPDVVERSILRVGVGATGIIALLCAVAALLASQEGCGSTDGSFFVDDVGARPSGYCQATQFPGFPDAIGSALLVGAVYLTPVLVIAGGTFIAARRGERDVFHASFALAAVLVAVAMVISLALAHVGYAGAG